MRRLMALAAAAIMLSAHEGDVWESAGATYDVAFRPLLPDERTCADVRRP
jgi:hypothetical protein